MPADRRDLRRSLFNLAAEQSGHFTAAQARRIGYSHQAQAYHVRSGNWLRVDRGLFRLAEWVPGVHDDLARWTLWSLGRGVISHESALAVHDIGEFESSRVHITAPPPFRMRDDAVIIHIANLSPTDIQDRTGFRVTTPTRSIIDMAAQSPDEDQLARAIDDGVRAGLVNIRRLRGWSEVVDPRAALYIERALAMTRRQ